MNCKMPYYTYWIIIHYFNLLNDWTNLGHATLGGPNPGSTVRGSLLGSPGENVAECWKARHYLAIVLQTPLNCVYNLQSIFFQVKSYLDQVMTELPISQYGHQTAMMKYSEQVGYFM